MFLACSRSDFGASNNISLAQAEQDDKKQAAYEHAFLNYQANKDNDRAVEAASTMMWVYFKRDEFDKATDAMKFVLQKTGGNVTNPDTITYLAYILNHNGNKFQAKVLLDGLLKSERPFPDEARGQEAL